MNVVLPDEIYEFVKELAAIERRSLSQMTAILVERGLATQPKTTPSTVDIAKEGNSKGRGKEKQRKRSPSPSPTSPSTSTNP